MINPIRYAEIKKFFSLQEDAIIKTSPSYALMKSLWEAYQDLEHQLNNIREQERLRYEAANPKPEYQIDQRVWFGNVLYRIGQADLVQELDCTPVSGVWYYELRALPDDPIIRSWITVEESELVLHHE